MLGLVSKAPAAAVIALALSSCTTGSISPADPAVSVSPSRGSATPLGARDVRRAEQAVKADLPDAPIWKGMKFEGVVVDDTTVCVDRTYAEGAGLQGKGGNAGYVLVQFPDVTTGQPQDGKCASRPPAPGPEKSDPIQVPAALADNPGLVTRDDLGSDWPLTTDYAILSCVPTTVADTELFLATLIAPDGTEYALNGTAKAHTDAADIEPIWAKSPDMDGTKVSIGPLIRQALALC